MRSKFLVVLFGFVGLLMLSACANEKNPIIIVKGIDVNPSSVSKGETAIITADVDVLGVDGLMGGDTGKVVLEYEWTATSGTIDKPAANPTTYKAPASINGAAFIVDGIALSVRTSTWEGKKESQSDWKEGFTQITVTSN